MRAWLVAAVMLGACSDDVTIEVTVGTDYVAIDVENTKDYVPIEEGCNDPGDDFDSASYDPPECAVTYTLATSDGVETVATHGSYQFTRTGLGGSLEIDGCGVNRLFELPDALPPLDEVTATRSADSVVVAFEAPSETATHYSASRAGNAVFSYLTCTVEGTAREIELPAVMRTGVSIAVVARNRSVTDGVIVDAVSDRVVVMQPEP